MFKKILLGFAALVVVFLIVVALQPNEYRIVRAAAVAAAPDRVFAQVNDFHNWEAWSPWAKLDPNAKATFEGPPSGKGAVFIWAGNDEVGEGRMTVTQSRPNDLIQIKLDFVKPMEGTSDVEFTFKPQGDPDQRHLDHERPPHLHQQGDLPVHEPGQDAGRLFRERPREPEDRGGRAAQDLSVHCTAAPLASSGLRQVSSSVFTSFAT